MLISYPLEFTLKQALFFNFSILFCRKVFIGLVTFSLIKVGQIIKGHVLVTFEMNICRHLK